MTSKPRRLSDEERALWEQAAADVAPFKQGGEVSAPAPASESAPEPAPAPKDPKPRFQMRPRDPRIGARARAEAAVAAVAEKTPPPDMTLGRRQIRAIKTGKVPVEARLDMHGLFKNQAKAILADFIEAASLSGKGAVLVITGKGSRKDGKPGVLRRMTPQWLKADPVASYIIGFSRASQGDGGEGALYVQLKKRSRRSPKK